MRLLDYIQGLRKGKEAHRLEKESMKDPFLADALDGFQEVEGNHAAKIEQLRKQVAARSGKQRKMYAWGWSVAACLLVGVGVGSYYLLFMQKDIEYQDLEILAEKSVPAMQLEDTVKPSTDRDTVRVIFPKQDNRRDVIAKVEEPPVADMAVANLEEEEEEEEAEATPDEIQDTNRNMQIAMNTDKTQLEEVVVIGYGTQKKRTITGSASTMKVESKPAGSANSAPSVPVIGKKQFKKYLKENLIRPTDEACKDCKGKVTVTFFVDSNGKPQHIIVTKGLCESADKEAIRLIQEGPEWTVSHLPVTVEVKF